MRHLLLSIGLGIAITCFALQASANPFERVIEATRMAEFKGVPENNFLPGKSKSRAGEKRAASRAKSAFPDSKILSVNYSERSRSYRVKLLSAGGVVKYVFVDPNSGEVFE